MKRARFVLLWLGLALGLNVSPAGARPFAITVVDSQTGRGVPLVELETVNDIHYVTDSNGVVAFDEPGLFGRTVFFHVRSHGYEFPKDGFGYRGKALEVTDGGSARLVIQRRNVAERLYRVTGAGIYRDSVLTGRPVPVREPLLNGQVFGSDSVVNARYRGKVYWFWGDTNRPAYPLGNFQVTGAVSSLPGQGGLAPDVGVDLTYFVDRNGFARGMAPLPGEGPTWIFGLVVLHSADGSEQMFAHYVKVRGFLDVYEHGMARYDDTREQFTKVAQFPLDSAVRPGGQTFLRKDGDTEYAYYCQPYPLLRVPATAEAITNIGRFEAYTCLVEGSRLSEAKIDRGADGRPRYAWKRNTPVVGPAEQASLIKKGVLKPAEGLLALRDVETGKPVQAHTGSVSWNDYRRRWVLIAVQTGGTSPLGEVWYAEADTPLGPWVYARKVVTHERYSFYNPKQHPFFDQDGGRVICFEGTYTRMFSGNEVATPRYEYNQVMYRLDLAEPRLNLPVPVYSAPNAGYAASSALGAAAPRGALFFALDRAAEGAVAVFQTQREPGVWTLAAVAPSQQRDGKPSFYALPASAQEPPPHTALLFEYRRADRKQPLYATELPADGYQRVDPPLCRVWLNPAPRGNRPE